jgi:hypothetical protein
MRAPINTTQVIGSLSSNKQVHMSMSHPSGSVQQRYCAPGAGQ